MKKFLNLSLFLLLAFDLSSNASLEITTIEIQDSYNTIQRFPGKILPLNYSKLAFEVPGKISEVKIDIGDTEETDQGYAKELTPEQIKMQQDGMKKICSQSDVIITTAQVFGRRAPRIITQDMVEAMNPGSVIVDMAVSTGGNVEGSKNDEYVFYNGVTIIGMSNLPGEVARDASQVFGSNLFNMIDEFWDKENNNINFDLEDEILKGCVITHQGSIVNESVK